MTFECSLTVTGMDPQKSIQAFIDSYNKTSNVSYYQKYHGKLEKYFIDRVNQNISRTGIKNEKLTNSFSVNFKGKDLNFQSNYPGAKGLEFGSGKRPPLRFIQPAVIDTTNELSDIIISEAINIYKNDSHFGLNVQKIIPQSNYFNKYSKMLK